MTDRRAHEKRVLSFLRSIENDAGALYLLGDILDFWFEYRTVVPRGHVRFFGQLARMADAGIEIVWFTGNHDIWLFDYLRDEIGIRVVDAPWGGVIENIGGKEFLLGHGDTFGPQPVPYRMLRAIFHNKVCQKLFSAIHPRWTLPFAHGWSSHSRKGAAAMPPRAELSDEMRGHLVQCARKAASEHPGLSYIMAGHYHVDLDISVTPQCRLVVLGNWIDRSTYAVFDGTELSLKEFPLQDL